MTAHCIRTWQPKYQSFEHAPITKFTHTLWHLQKCYLQPAFAQQNGRIHKLTGWLQKPVCRNHRVSKGFQKNKSLLQVPGRQSQQDNSWAKQSFPHSQHYQLSIAAWYGIYCNFHLMQHTEPNMQGGYRERWRIKANKVSGLFLRPVQWYDCQCIV